MKAMQIVIIGAGEFGRTIDALLEKKGAIVHLWDADRSKVVGERPLSEIIPAADMVFFCVPSWAMRKAFISVKPFLKKKTPLVSFAKGIEDRSKKTMAELFTWLAPGHPLAVVGGPMIAEEIRKGQGAVGIIASKDKKLKERLHFLFTSRHFRAEDSEDMFSVCLGGALKNIYAVALGIADGLKWDNNDKGWLAGEAVGEMAQIAQKLGARRAVILGAAGVGDLIATAYSPFSRNREAGRKIAAQGKGGLPCEGLMSLMPLIARLEAEDATLEKFPLLTLIKKTGVDAQPARALFKDFYCADGEVK